MKDEEKELLDFLAKTYEFDTKRLAKALRLLNTWERWEKARPQPGSDSSVHYAFDTVCALRETAKGGKP